MKSSKLSNKWTHRPLEFSLKYVGSLRLRLQFTIFPLLSGQSGHLVFILPLSLTITVLLILKKKISLRLTGFLAYNQCSQNVDVTAPTMDPISSWLLPRSTAIGWLNEEDTISSNHLWWWPFTSTFCERCLQLSFLCTQKSVTKRSSYSEFVQMCLKKQRRRKKWN